MLLSASPTKLTTMTTSKSEKSSSLVYSPEAHDLRPTNKCLTSLSFHSDEYCVLIADIPFGAIVPLHSHSDRESFYILSGEMNLYHDASWRTLKQGEFVDVRFSRLVQNYGYWLGTPEDNEAIGLSVNWG
jgi:hypothetical protein